MDKTQSGATIPDLSGPGSNGNEEVLHILQHSRTWASLRAEVISYKM